MLACESDIYLEDDTDSTSVRDRQQITLLRASLDLSRQEENEHIVNLVRHVPYSLSGHHASYNGGAFGSSKH